MKFKVELDIPEDYPKEEIERQVKNIFHTLQVQIWDTYKIKKKITK